MAEPAKATKTQKSSSCRKLTEDDTDFFIIHINKKKRNIEKKLKEIKELEGKDKKTLNEAQLDKLKKKSECEEQINHWDDVIKTYNLAKKEAGIQSPEKTPENNFQPKEYEIVLSNTIHQMIALSRLSCFAKFQGNINLIANSLHLKAENVAELVDFGLSVFTGLNVATVDTVANHQDASIQKLNKYLSGSKDKFSEKHTFLELYELSQKIITFKDYNGMLIGPKPEESLCAKEISKKESITPVQAHSAKPEVLHPSNVDVSQSGKPTEHFKLVKNIQKEGHEASTQKIHRDENQNIRKISSDYTQKIERKGSQGTSSGLTKEHTGEISQNEKKPERSEKQSHRSLYVEKKEEPEKKNENHYKEEKKNRSKEKKEYRYDSHRHKKEQENDGFVTMDYKKKHHNEPNNKRNNDHYEERYEENDHSRPERKKNSFHEDFKKSKPKGSTDYKPKKHHDHSGRANPYYEKLEYVPKDN